MTNEDHRPGLDQHAELRLVEAELERLQARRAWLLDQLGDDVRRRPGTSVQQVLLTTGAGLLGLAGLFFAAVAWALVGPPGRLAILLVLAVGLAALATWTRPRLGGAAAAIASVAASMMATALYSVPELWQVTWSDSWVATYTATVSAALCVAYTVAALVTGIRSWTAAAALAAAVGVVAAGIASATALDDPLGYTSATAVLTLAVAATGARIRARRAWWFVLGVAASSSLLSMGAWVLEPGRTMTYAGALLGWAVVSLVAQRQASAKVPGVVAWTLSATLVAAAASLLVGTQPWGAPSLPLAAGGVVVATAVAYAPAVPTWPGTAVALVLGAGAVTVPVIHGAATETDRWVTYFCLLAVAAAAAGWSPRRRLQPNERGLLWWTAGAAASAGWLTHLSADRVDGPVEWIALPVGALSLLAGGGWMLSVHRSVSRWLPTVTALLPGLLMTLLPGALASWSLTWSAGLSDSLVRTVCYTLVGAVLAALGARLRVAALLIAGEATIAVCVLAHLSAATREVPQWVALAAGGALLLAVGARWEWLRDQGAATARRVGRLR